MVLPSSLAISLPLLEEAARPFGAAGPDLTRYVMVCVLLVVLTGGLALALRKGLAATMRARAGRRSLAVLDVLPLGGRQRVLVVRCYDRTFLLGQGDKELNPIAELDPSIGKDATPSKAPLAADREAFARALEKVRQSLPAARLGPGTLRPAAAPAAPARAAAAPRAPEPAAAAGSERGSSRPRLEGVVG